MSKELIDSYKQVTLNKYFELFNDLQNLLDSRFHGNDSQEPCHSSEGWNPEKV
jgi:hypothetical protein